MSGLVLRDVVAADMAPFFDQARDPDALWMAAFAADDLADLPAFEARWALIHADPANRTRTVVVDGAVAGYVGSFPRAGHTEVSYWFGRAFWGQGVATRALAAFLADHEGPCHARVAKDHVASRRVLEKNGFATVGEDKGFARARGAEIAEWVLRREA